LKTIGLVTTGGDAPGMNAAIRAVTRIATAKNIKILGFEWGWNGLLNNICKQLTPRTVGGIIQTGGTFLHTSRSHEFKQKEGLRKSAETLKIHDIDGLIVIGGDGSLKGALDLSKETDSLIVGIPATIDNDVFGTEETIGFDTAVNTAATEIDKIRDTADSLGRTFIVETMGRTRGFLTLNVGITVGAEIILVPEVQCNKEEIYRTIKINNAKGKRSSIIVAAEGIGDTRLLGKDIENNTGAEVRLSVIGYAQRGGSPSARSRLLACLFANEAIEQLSNENGNKITCLKDNKITSIDLEACLQKKKLDLNLLQLATLLAT
jgi:6-phosphofructokinase 1